MHALLVELNRLFFLDVLCHMECADISENTGLPSGV
jgi:hypothetical protein